MKFHGYTPFSSYLFNIDELELELEDFVLNTYENLLSVSSTVIHNKNEFIEIHRPLVLIITKL